MLDDLRNDAASSPDPDPTPEDNELAELASRRRKRGPFLGMSPAQRFILVLVLFLMACVLGTFCLIVFNKIVLPI
jgi:hypothetical protein